MKAILLATALMLIGTQAQATWAEGPNQENAVFTGTNASLARAHTAGRHYRHSARRPYVHRRYERW
jgi:hypothetical protein